MPPSYIAHFAAGPPLYHPTLGMLAGPPTALVPADGSGPVLLVDDRNAGLEIEQGPHRARLVTTAEALHLLTQSPQPPPDAPLEVAQAPAAGDAPVTSLRQAASLLRVGRSTLSRRIRGLPPGQLPANTGTADQPRWWWASQAECLSWWRRANLAAGPPAGAPRGPRSRPTAAPKAAPGEERLVARLAALEDALPG